MSLCSCVSNSHKFPAEFRWLSAPPVRICINFLSNFFVAAPVEKVEFLWWQDWLPIIRRRINFPIGARNQLNLLLLLDAPHYFSPYCSCQCIVSMLELWCVFWDKRHWLRPPSSPLPLPILPRLQEAEQSKSLTADKTLVLGTFTMPSFNYQMLKYQNIILDGVLSIFGIKNYLQSDNREKYCVKSSFQNQSSW